MTTPSANPSDLSAPASPTAGALLVATAPTPASAEAEALLWRPLRGRSLAAWALAKMVVAVTASPHVAVVVIVARTQRAAEAESLVAGLPDIAPSTRVVLSEPDWRASLVAGLAALPDTCAWIVIHDAARPLLTPASVAAGYAVALAAQGVALVGESVNDTLKRVVDGRVVETPPRATLRRLTPPLVIRRDLLERALSARATHGETDADGLAEIALASGARLATYTPAGSNPAIASEADWPLLEALLAAQGEA